MAVGLKPFWSYYGGKWRAAPRYPTPRFGTIVEPFAGAAGYACQYPWLDVVLIDSYPVVAGIWDFLIRVPAAEIRAIPEVEAIDDLPSWVPQEARDLIGFWLHFAVSFPRKRISAGARRHAEKGWICGGWNIAARERIASQVEHIRHWKIVHGDALDLAPDFDATWFVDPPYNNRAGSYYVHSDIDYPALASWCKRAKGQVIVCENEGADWLPFRPFATLKAGVNGKGSREVIWEGG